ncbi:soluble lytic murein transglycosylase [Tumebacillus sp. BK434]|uniref:lytic transglycosylase domain-containing protein n=1 Tax=Tumebacillus sp. BK434 TaxID=2512169 RepID=UPI0010497D21|nr:lytic transglycosylase domain-containing protein [Tumebacillus sp. BK434]TCP53743.1 soluble lytic murein transglycosylase [Tumebacillus sp. BK434]
MIWPRISWVLTPQAKRKVAIILGLIFLIVLAVGSDWFWRFIYPIYHEAEIRQAAETHQIDPLLVAAIIRVESKFRTENVSKVGAVGLMQLMPETAEWIAKESEIPYRGIEDLSDPETNIRMGSWYMAYLLKQFDGNQAAAIAAYNAGQGRVSRWMKEGVWDGTLAASEKIPVGETRHYIQRVSFSYTKYQQLYPDF